MYCMKCGKKAAEDAKFCEYCGAALNIETKKISEVRNVKTRHKGNAKIIATICVVAVLIVAFQMSFGTIKGHWYACGEERDGVLDEEIVFRGDGTLIDGSVVGQYWVEDGKLIIYFNALTGYYERDYKVKGLYLHLYRGDKDVVYRRWK